MNVYQVGPDTVIATDEIDAFDILNTHYGSSEDYVDEVVSRLEDDAVLTVGFEDYPNDGDVPEGARVEHSSDPTKHWLFSVTAKAKEWATLDRGFLASTEW
jgi:hypothetical protein